MTDLGLEVLSSITTWSKYARYIPELKRRETWGEICDRYENMMIRKYPQLASEIVENMQYVRKKKVLPSMRALQFAGAAAEVNNARIYNCCYLPIDSVESFSEGMFLLLGGTGVGYSVQKHHVAKLPKITVPTKTKKYVIQDSIIGWADAVKVLMEAYLKGKALPIFDYREIREKGARLVTAGGKAPGPEPLKIVLEKIAKILSTKKENESLSTLECHDIMCHIANAVLAGGIRRSACIAGFSPDDEEMLTCKYGEWWVENEQRGRANNSVILLRNSVSEEEFKLLWSKIKASGSGEPGIYWTNDATLEEFTNPCCEIALKPYQFCNLCEINTSNIENQEDFNKRAEVAAFFGTLQAGFTDFHYLRPIWKETTEKEALIGVGQTGIASKNVLKLNLTEAAKCVVEKNKEIAKIININPAARTTCIKPSGTTSCVLKTSSGIHPWYSNYFLRTMRFGKGEEIALYLMVNHPELVEEDVMRPQDTICVRFPIKAPEGAITTSETAIDMLERVKKFSLEWILPGHVSGTNTHNVSATVYIKKDKMHGEMDEWEAVGKWMWENKNFYNGLSVLPFDDNTYVQAPFEEISKEEYEKRIATLKYVDVTKIIEEDDEVNFGQTAACAGGACEI